MNDECERHLRALAEESPLLDEVSRLLASDEEVVEMLKFLMLAHDQGDATDKGAATMSLILLVLNRLGLLDHLSVKDLNDGP